MQSKEGLLPAAEVLSGLDGPVKALHDASPQALHHFTQADQVNQLAAVREADPDLGFMARLMVLCSLPRTNPGDRKEYRRVNGPYKLIMTAIGDNKLPYGSLPRLLLAWVCTEAVRTQSRDLVLGTSLSEFMRKLGLAPVSSGTTGGRTRLRNQMRRLFRCHVQLIHEHKHGEQFVSSAIADRGEFWWNERKPDEPSLWESKIYLGEAFFNEIIRHPVPLDMNTLTALKRCALGLDLYLWLAPIAPSRSRARYASPGVRSTVSLERPKQMGPVRTPFKCSVARFSAGCVATFKKQQVSDWSGRSGSVSCNHLEQLVDELNLSPNIRTARPPRLPLPDHVHCLVSLDRSPRRLKLTKPLLGFHSSFDCSMVLLQDVVQVLDRPVAATASQDSFLFHS